MDTMIVYVDDAPHALGVLQPWLAAGAGARPRQWILVACAPRVTQHVSKWVTHSARESWRGKWVDKLTSQLSPRLQALGDEVITCLGKNNLPLQAEELQRSHGPARVIDARRPKQVVGEFQPRALPGTGVLGLWLALVGVGALNALE